MVDVKGYLLAYQLDSLDYDNVYGILIRGERLEDVDMRSLPLAALSKQNREKWAFQNFFYSPLKIDRNTYQIQE